MAGVNSATSATRVQPPQAATKKTETVMWLNPLDLKGNDPSTLTAHDATQTSARFGLSGLLVKSTITGNQCLTGEGKSVDMGVSVPPGYVVEGVRIAYESSSPKTKIEQIRISQLNDPPTTATVRMDETPPAYTGGPTTVTVKASFGKIDPKNGALELNLFTTFANTDDSIIIRGVGLILKKI